jgi:FG-GAP-like repeat
VGKVRLFSNREGGNFQTVADFDLGTQPSALVAADLDLDGDIDLAATDRSNATIIVLFNNSAGQFDPPRDASGGLFETRLGPVSLAVPDLNADGVPDLVAAGANLGVLLSNP